MSSLDPAAPADLVKAIEPISSRDIPTWDDEVDVIVVGLGCAGAATAIEASERGASVLVLERAGAGGGTSAMAGGLIYLGGGTRVQRNCGFDDTPQQMETFLRAACGDGADLDKIHHYARDSVAQFDWLVAHGVPFKDEFDEQHDREPRTDATLLFSGGEDAAPFDAITPPVPRAHKPQYPDSAGNFLMERMLAAVAATTARVQTDTRVDALVVDDEGRVVGVVANHLGERRTIRAHKGVVLTAGGFIFNPAMVEHYVPEAARCLVPVGTDNDDGSGIRLGQGVGAALRAMDNAECALPIMPPRSLARGVLINGEGRRFVNEDTYTGRIGQKSLFGQDGHVYLIVDEDVYVVNSVGMRIGWAAESPAELATELGIPVDAFVETIERYNADAAAGLDTEFGKHADYLQPLMPAVGAIDLRVESAIYAPFTLGGLDTTVDSEVRSTDGAVIPGLFAAGRTTAGLATNGYASGISLGDGLYFGRRAGCAATGGTWA